MIRNNAPLYPTTSYPSPYVSPYLPLSMYSSIDQRVTQRSGFYGFAHLRQHDPYPLEQSFRSSRMHHNGVVPSVDEESSESICYHRIGLISKMSYLVPIEIKRPTASRLEQRRSTGFIAFSSTTVYYGELLLGLPDGHGRLMLKATNELVYNGEWKEGYYHGRGILYRNGYEYCSGYFENNIFVQGRMVGADESFRIGSFVDGKLNGLGRVVYPSLAVVSGEWKDDLPVGTMHYSLPGGYEFDYDEAMADLDTKRKVHYHSNYIFFHDNTSEGYAPDYLFFSNGDIFVGESVRQVLPSRGLYFHTLKKGYYKMLLGDEIKNMKIKDISISLTSRNTVKSITFI